MTNNTGEMIEHEESAPMAEFKLSDDTSTRKYLITIDSYFKSIKGLYFPVFMIMSLVMVIILMLYPIVALLYLDTVSFIMLMIFILVVIAYIALTICVFFCILLQESSLK